MTYQDGIPAGTDLYLSSGSETSLSSFQSSATFCQYIREASKRILYVVANYSAAMNGISPDTTVSASAWWWRTAIIAGIAVSAVLTAGCGAMYAVSLVKERKKSRETI